MISFNNIGHMGRLGNQMFQYAALRGIAAHKGYWYSLPRQNELTNCFEIPETLLNQNNKILNIETFEFDQNFFDTCPDDVDIMGYFQSEKYFKHIEQDIRRDFTFSDKTHNICSHYRKDVFPNQELISVHVRRTDYLTESKFVSLDLDYYKNALDLLPKDLPVIIFSDDPSWCKQYFSDKRFRISVSNNSHIDLCLMSLCDYHVIANSSFSWWGSWLAKSKKTIAPQKWFCGEFENLNTKDLYLKDWTVI